METNIESVAKKCIENVITHQLLKKDSNIDSVIKELNIRCDNMICVVEKKQEDIDNFNNLFLGLIDQNDIDNRLRYMFYFVTNAKSQIKNLKWIIKNKHQFTLSNEKMYKLSIFRDKIKIK